MWESQYGNMYAKLKYVAIMSDVKERRTRVFLKKRGDRLMDRPNGVWGGCWEEE